ncbi:MFS transporter [Enterococcus rotai]|uniref:MFS transporter n=1 Tax=Enterococcus rotai TaxID=118060 RepID=UPI0032B3F518
MNKNKAFNKLIIGQMIANIGDTIYTIAIVSSVFTLTNSVLAASIVPVIITGSMVLSGLLTPLIVVRVSLSKILQISQLCKTLILAGLAVYLQVAIEHLDLTILYVFIAGIAFLDGCAEPVSTALIPYYVAEHYLIRANSLFSTMLQVVSIGSWAIGSSLLIIFSVTNLVWLDVGLFATSAVILWLLPQVAKRVEPKENEWENFIIGWQGIRKQSLVRMVVKMDILETIANTAWVSAIVLVYVKEVLHVSESWWGYINATYFAGAMVGSVIVMRNSDWINQHKSKAVIMGSLFGGVVTFLVGPGWNPIFILICSVFVGIFSQIKNIPQATAIQQTSPKDMLAPIYAAMNVLYTGTFALSSVSMGLISESFGVQTVFGVSGTLLFVVAMIAKKKRTLFDG